MNTQEAYEKIRAHFANGGELAKDADGMCQYRTEVNGIIERCAVGALIPDDLYTSDMEGTVTALLREHPVIKGYLWDVDYNFLQDAQRLHDIHAKNGPFFTELLDILAVVYGLTTTGYSPFNLRSAK